MSHGDSQQLRVLHVCTGNICRSPMAEALTRDFARKRSVDIVVSSAGTWGHEGSPMEAHALSTLTEYGIDGSDFRARELTAEHVEQADLVLGATGEHRSAAAELGPDATSRAFTLREFARLCATVTPDMLPSGSTRERGLTLIRLVADARPRRGRGLRGPRQEPAEDLADPFHAPRIQFLQCAELIAQALQGPLDLLASTPSR